MKIATSSHLLIIGVQMPEPQSSAAGHRMMQLIDLFQAKGYSITFACVARDTAYSDPLTSRGIPVFTIAPNTKETSHIFKKIDPDIVVFDRFMIEEQFGWRLSEVCPDAVRILDTEDLHFLRKARQIAHRQNRSVSPDDLYSLATKRELASILRCDLSLIISEKEYDILTKKFKIDGDLLYYLPFLIDSKEYLPHSDPRFEERDGFMFIGNFLHPPNYDAVLYLKNEVWPMVRAELPRAAIHIYGAYTSQKVKQLENRKDNFFICGRTRDLSSVLRKHRVLLAPLRFGAGLKGKFIDAMGHGLPAITSSIGAEGLCDHHLFPGAVVESPMEIAQKSATLYKDEHVWKSAQLQGYKILKSRFEKRIFSSGFLKHIEQLIKNLETHRHQHFIGEILMHHRQQSTKYMSRWIETKHKLHRLKN